MELDQWLAAVAAEIGADLTLDSEQISTLLDVARDAAHEVERVAAPLTTFLVGVAVGRGASLDTAAAQATALAMTFGADPPPTDASTDNG